MTNFRKKTCSKQAFQLIPNSKIKVILAKTYGFCPGVERAIKMVDSQWSMANGKKGRIFILNEIVHNPFIVREFEKKGIKSVKSLKEIPKGSTVIFSAHGVSPKIIKEAKKRGLKIVDATCPLVLKVHQLVKNFSQKGYQIIYIGDKNHEEVKGIKGEAGNNLILINAKCQINSQFQIPNSKLAIFTQTTLALDETKEKINRLKKIFPRAEIFNTVCQATNERQKAIKELAKRVELIIVVGGKNSANSKMLVKVAKSQGIKAFLVESKKELKKEWFKKVKKVGLTAGASTPDYLVKEVKKEIQKI